ncbi:four helix bundle protein [Neolewinella antarctica]|uniref:Four helix bundle protein n=1 Tax=Neolewinella antarctica TaxID=442734 RepID=A0ABX0X9Q3_9BACT|nr:four helix bundle protein [Neolewinella antarctica]NJC25990.1 four helix bundle protein [Neolewinella antarctica]
MNANELEERLLQFGVRCTYLCRELHKLNYFDSKHVAGQLLRASTHAGFHYPEARAAESNRDFVHKIKVLLKELRESKAELQYVRYMNYFPDQKTDPLLDEANQLVAIFTATVKKLAVNKLDKAKRLK